MSTAAMHALEPIEAAPEATTMCEALVATAERHAHAVALRTFDGETEITFGEYLARVRTIAAGFAAMGVGRGDTVAVLLRNRPEFHLCDSAAVFAGATPFSIYATCSPEQIAYLFENANTRVIITETAFVHRVVAARGERAEPSTIVCVDGAPDGTISLAEFEAGGSADFDFETTWRAVRPDDVLTLIYTSGTTGPPKGVETTHANMLAQCRAVGKVLPMRPGARITSYLPSAHIADRWSSHYSQMVWGLQVSCVPDMQALAPALVAVRPTVWGAVPRVMEKLKAALEAGIAAEPDDTRRDAVRAAISLGIEKVRFDQAEEEVPSELRARYEALDATVLSGLRTKLGLEQAEWIIVGAAPLSRDVHEFFMAIGLPVLEIYGMSEASCCITMLSPAAAKIGWLGPPLDCLEAKTSEDGELLVRGPTVMRGYRNEPEKTAEAIDSDGWLHTGDIVAINDRGYLRIVDRKKEIIISAGGKNMSPANIESEIVSAHPLIGQVVVIGDGRPYNVALIVLDSDAAAAFAAKAELADRSVAAVAADPAAREQIAAAVEAANQRLARVEQIKRFDLLADAWLPGGDELTPTMKLRRKPIDAKYADAITALYAG
jgi:long-chain acyl-CoA synthetase